MEDEARRNIARAEIDRGCNVNFIRAPGLEFAGKNQEHWMKVACKLAY